MLCNLASFLLIQKVPHADVRVRYLRTLHANLLSILKDLAHGNHANMDTNTMHRTCLVKSINSSNVRFPKSMTHFV